ncbi:MAG: ATP-binding protein [bacterium]
MRMTIGKKLMGGFSIVLILLMILSAMFFYAIARMNSASNFLIENLKLDMFLDEKIGDHLRWLNDLSDQFLLGRSFEGELDPHKCDFGKWYDVFNADDPEIEKIHKSIEQPHNKLHYSALKIKKLYEAGAIEEAKKIFAEETGPAVRELEQKVTTLVDISMEKIHTASQEYEATSNISRILVSGVTILSIFIGLIISFLISQSISRTVQTFADASDNIARGDLTTEIKIMTNDEIGDLARSYNKMVKDLKRLMNQEKEFAAAKAVAEVEKKRALELSQIYNGSPSGIRVVNRDFNVMSQNKAMLKLSGTKTAKNIKCYEQLKGTLCSTEFCTLTQILNGKEIIDTEVIKEGPDGRKFPCRVMASPYKDIQGNTIGIIEVFTDITELKETEEKLIRHEKLAVLGKLSGTLGHELRNPLGVISNSIYYLKIKLAHIKEGKIQKHLSILEQEVEIANKIITDILSFARVKELQVMQVNIKRAIADSLAKVHIPSTIEVTTNFGNDIPLIMADKIQLTQVFSNIILNAVQAMPDGGMLTIEVHRNDTDITIDIMDEGEGIPEENMDKIFEPLFSTKAHGTGLGLCVCQSIIELHQGKIEIDCNGAQGTKFIIHLPIIYNNKK